MKKELKRFEGIYGTLDHIVVKAKNEKEAREMLPRYIDSPIMGALHIVREIDEKGR